MKGRVTWPGGVVEVDGSPEEVAAFAAALARAPAPNLAPSAAPTPAPTPASSAVASVVAPRPAAALAPVMAESPVAKVIATTFASTVADDVHEDDGEVPGPARIRDFLASRPDFEHSIQDVFHHFAAGPVSPTMPDGTLNPVHQRWMASINKARALIIQEKKGFFKTEWRGGQKVYVFWFAPFQDFGGPVAR